MNLLKVACESLIRTQLFLALSQKFTQEGDSKVADFLCSALERHGFVPSDSEGDKTTTTLPP